ncbi:MAG: replication factor C large subunit [archaeon]
MIWTRKYQPKAARDVIGQESAVSRVRELIKAKKPGLLYGPTGSGKTCAVHAVAAEEQLEIIEVNASDFRNKDMIDSVVGAAIKQQSLFFRGKVILVDEVDGVSGTKDRGGIPELVKLFSDSTYPVMMTANDPWDKKFSTLRKKAELVEFSEVGYLSAFVVLKNICRLEEITYDELALKGLARRSGGDLRAAINDLQSVAQEKGSLTREDLETLGVRNREESIANALVRIFKTTDPMIAKQALDNVDEDLDKCMLWIDENLPKEYTRPEDLFRAYESISRADVLKGRIRRWQHWRFLAYISELITAGVAVAKDEKYKSQVSYTQTTRLLKIWQANMRNMKKKEIARKIADATHVSAQRVVADIEFYRQMFRNKGLADLISEEVGLSKDETGWMRK